MLDPRSLIRECLRNVRSPARHTPGSHVPRHDLDGACSLS